MNRLARHCLAILPCCLAMQAWAAPAGDSEEQWRCNQLGREIALRAAEQMSLELDTETRRQLAAIAELACLDVESPPAVSAAPSASPGPAPDQESDDGLFSLERIDPADRVRRPGLKRR